MGISVRCLAQFITGLQTSIASQNLDKKFLHSLAMALESLCTIHFFSVTIYTTSYPTEQYKYFENHEIMEAVQLRISTVTEQENVRSCGRSKVLRGGIVCGCA